MKTIELLNIDMQLIKRKLKVVRATEIVVAFFERKEEFVGVDIIGEKVSLFRDNLVSCGRLGIKITDVRRFENTTSLEDKTKFSALKRAIQVLEKENELVDVMFNVIDENLK